MSGIDELRNVIGTLAEVDGRKVWPALLEAGALLDVTDIHLEPTADGARLRVRRDGELIEVGQISADVRDRLVMSLKNLAGMTAYVHSRPQDGRLRLAGLTVRAATVPVLHGEKVTLRLLAPVSKIRRLESLGMRDVQTYLRMMNERPGMTLCVGPAGSGKSTTLYATLIHLWEAAGGRMSVATIEDPVEYEVPAFNQTPVNAARGLTFAAGLRSIVRHDPNAILVGEIRDRETAATAFQAALSGHLVMSTMHGTDAPSALYRLLDMGIEPDVLGGGLSAIVAQRLVPRVCESCRGEGCPACEGAGRRGRVGVFELMAIDEAVGEAMRGRVPIAQLRARLAECGFVDLRAAFEEKLRAGEVSGELR